MVFITPRCIYHAYVLYTVPFRMVSKFIFLRKKEGIMDETAIGKWVGVGGALLLFPVAIWLFVLGLGGSASGLYRFCCWLI